MKLFYQPALVLALLAMFVFSCERPYNELASSEEDAATVLNAVFSDYEIVTLNSTDILRESAEKKEERFLIDLAIPSQPDWSFEVVYHNFYGPDVKSFESDAAGGWVEVASPTTRNESFFGFAPANKAIHGMFIMMDDNFEAEIYAGEVEYALNPLTQYVPSASRDEYVLYRLDADIGGNQFVCGTDEPHTNTTAKETGAPAEKMDQCRELGLNYIADYEMWDGKFNRDDSGMRNYIENRLQFGSYRYWGRNDYPLYVRLYNRYVRKNTRNRPITSDDKVTALNQFVTWSNNTNNMLYADQQTIFTGKDFGGLFGRAKIGAVCARDNNNNYHARAMVTRLNHISSGVYSKVVAHEIGHNLGALHKDLGFMKQGNHRNEFMPRATRDELDAYISGNNRCMDLRNCRDFHAL